jgi:succinate dehydrogenase / fumarate reductase cytochrome b subunit
MAASIVHRATGIALYAGSFLLALWVFLAALGREAFAPFGAFLASPFGQLVLFGYVWALLFHLLAGLRYLYFDSGRGLAPKTATKTSIAIFVASLFLAVAVAGFAFALRG